MNIMGISMGGFFALCILLIVILVVLIRKWKRKVEVDVSPPHILGSHLVGITGSAGSSHHPTPGLVVVEEVEMENLESVLRGDNSK